MKTSLTLSTVLFALTLSPAAFANGAQEQAPNPASTSAAASVTVYTVQQVPAVMSVTRSALAKLDVDVRAGILDRLRASSEVVIEALQGTAPAFVAVAAKPLELSAR